MYGTARHGTASPILVQTVRLAAMTERNWSHEADALAEAKPSEDAPGNRNTAVPSGEHAVLLLGVDHGLVNCHGGGGVDNGAGSVGQSEEASQTHIHET